MAEFIGFLVGRRSFAGIRADTPEKRDQGAPQMESSAHEILYVLKNPAFPALLKLGRTKNLPARLAALSNSTALPYAFTVAYAARVPDAALLEQQLHKALAPHRVSQKREFFQVPLECVIAIIELVSVETLPAECVAGGQSERAMATGRASKPAAPKLQAIVSKEDALADLKDLLMRGEPFQAQREMQVRWHRPRSTISDWLREWEAAALIPARRTIGRCKMLHPTHL